MKPTGRRGRLSRRNRSAPSSLALVALTMLASACDRAPAPPPPEGVYARATLRVGRLG